ncbi:hypothetical protein CYMTET_53350 [Cymbomonas tetramitiformis]|uniref:Uncharacterized protein n=1 Tax=Cymbomonas tetramitiformis TaxID=36881 RepID=A0AAE0ERU1_9CHLO|nr:hypothetical protein CYMTET_53350 [Cymbomonas tetramitiformis]
MVYDDGDEEWLTVAEDRTCPGGGIRASSQQTYLSAINNFHEDRGFEGPAKGRSVTRAVKEMTAMQTAAAEAAGETETERTWLPAKYARTVHEAGNTDTGTSLQREHVLMGDDELSVALTREKGKNHQRVKRWLSIPRRRVTRLRELLELWTRSRDEAWRENDPRWKDEAWRENDPRWKPPEGCGLEGE